MVQDQLVEYISSQMKAGTSRDSIKNTLVAAGWQTADVEDTLQKVESVKTSQPITASPSTLGTASTAAAVSAAASSLKTTGPQTIKMSDLISTSDPAIMSAGNPVAPSQKVFTGSSKSTETKADAFFSGTQYPAKPARSHGALITEIILGILVVVIGGCAGYLYFANNNLSSQIAAANSSSASAASQLAALQKSNTASSTSLSAQVATLNGQNKELQTELSFYAVPPSTLNGATSTGTINGLVSGGGKTPYVITATYGAKIFVANSKDASVTIALAPLEASDTIAAFTGTYTPGVYSITLTAVNGTSL